MSLADGLAGRRSREGFRVGVDDDGVAVISIDRAAKRNAITLDMWEALPSLLTDLTSVEGLRVLLITGEGESFSAGADVRELHDIYAEPSRARAYQDTNIAAEGALASFPYPTVAAIRGACIGGGCRSWRSPVTSGSRPTRPSSASRRQSSASSTRSSRPRA